MKHYAQGGIYTAEMGQPPTDLQEPTSPPKKPKKPEPKKPEPKKPVPKDSVFREGMPVPQDIDGGSVRMKRGGTVKKMSTGGSASKRADGIAIRGKTRGTMC